MDKEVGGKKKNPKNQGREIQPECYRQIQPTNQPLVILNLCLLLCEI